MCTLMCTYTYFRKVFIGVSLSYAKMRRKVVKHGSNTLTISLPSKWAKAHNIKQGDELNIEEEGNNIVIKTGKGEQTMGEAVVHFPKASDFFKRYIARAYILGYNKIKVTYDDPDVYKQYSNRMSELLGFEIVEQGTNYVVVKNLAKGIDEEFDNVLNRLFLMVIDMGNSLIESVKKNDLDGLKGVINIDKTTDKLNVFCKRLLHVHGYKKDEKQSKGIYRITCYVESVADEFRKFAKTVLEDKVKPSPAVMNLLKRLIEQLRFFYKLYNKFSHSDFIDYRNKEKDMELSIHKTFKKTKGDAVLLSYLYSIYTSLHHASEELF